MTFTHRFHQLEAHNPAPIPKDASNRRGYVGGSEIAAVLNLEPYGCARRLWYRKTHQPEDRPFRETGPMRVGTVMEDWIADEVERQFGLKLRRKAPVQGMEHEGAHIDRHIVAMDERGPGVLEIKCIGRQAYWKWLFDGVPQQYVLQLQWYMRLTGWKWGAIAAWNREHDGDGEVKLYQFEYDDELMALVSERVDEFWQRVTDRNPPPPLNPRDTRCDACEFGASCRDEEWANVGGDERRDDLIQIVQQFDDARAIVKSAEEHKEQCQSRLVEALGDTATAYAGPYKVSYAPQESMRIDAAGLKLKYPEIYKEVAVRSLSRPLRVTTKKEKA